jgi:hypothetical protein
MAPEVYNAGDAHFGASSQPAWLSDALKVGLETSRHSQIREAVSAAQAALTPKLGRAAGPSRPTPR